MTLGMDGPMGMPHRHSGMRMPNLVTTLKPLLAQALMSRTITSEGQAQ